MARAPNELLSSFSQSLGVSWLAEMSAIASALFWLIVRGKRALEAAEVWLMLLWENSVLSFVTEKWCFINRLQQSRRWVS